jgi:hypothetical protein
MSRWVAAVGVLGAVAALTSCAQQTPVTPQDIADKVTVDAMVTHLQRLQDIADTHDGTRADGTAGFDATVDYIAQFLRDKGFDVSTPEFEMLDRTEGGRPSLRIAGREYPVDQASLLITTPPGGLNAITTRPRNPAGCRRDPGR